MDFKKIQTINIVGLVLIVIFFLVSASAAWASPYVTVDDLFPPTSLTGLQPTSITAVVWNSGDSGSFTANLYIDGYYIRTDYYSMSGSSHGNITYNFSYGSFPGGYHTITVCAANCRTEGWTWSGTPDLTALDIYTTPVSLTAGENCTLRALVKNIGNANAGSFYVELYIDGEYRGYWDLSGLNALYSVELYIENLKFTNGTHSIEFIVDTAGEVAESNEGNNYRIEYLTWTGGSPDMELQDISNPTSSTAGVDSTITATLVNIGYANAGPFYAEVYVDGEYRGYWDISSGLAARTGINLIYTDRFVNGTHGIQFIADTDSEVAESNESNNSRTEYFTWTGGSPDLEVTTIYQPTSLTAGQDSSIKFRVTNIGYADAVPFYVYMYIDGEYAGYIDFYAGLPGRRYSEVTLPPIRFVNGAHSIQFVADATGDVAESNEGNNSRTGAWIWTGGTPDLELTDIYDPTSLTSGEDTIITGEIINAGYGDAGPFHVGVYVDGQYLGSAYFDSGLSARSGGLVNLTKYGGYPDGTYSFRFVADSMSEVAESNEGNNERTESFVWTVLPTSPPTGVSAVSGPGSGQVTLRWNLSPDPDIAYYVIYEGTVPGYYDNYYNNIPAGWSTGLIISGLTSGETYYYVITAVDTSGYESEFSNMASATTTQTGDTEPPSIPSNLNIVDPGTGRDLQLIWNSSTDDTGVSHYLVYRLTNNANVSEYNYDYGFPQYAYGTSFTDSGLSTSNTYYYRVLAVDTSDNWSGLSNLAWDEPDDNAVPSAPSYVGISAGTDAIDLWWSSPTTNTDGSPLMDLRGFNIYRGTLSGNYGVTPINGAYPYQGVSFTDSGVISGQTYYYAIRTVDNDGHEGPFSMEVSAGLASETQPPSSPAGLSITEKETELMLTWNPNYESDLAGYNIYRGTSSGYYSRINFALLSGASYVDRNVSAGQTYYYVVTAVDENGNESGFSNEVSGMINQGNIWINYPTQSNRATIDFSYLLSQDADKQEAVNPSSRAVIDYDYNGYTSLVYVEIKDSDTAEVVYWGYDWQPPRNEQDHKLTWDGKYSYINECVPDGLYDVRMSGAFGLLTSETEERGSVSVSNCDLSKMKVEITNPDDGDNFDLTQENFKATPEITFKGKITPSDIADTINWTLNLEYKTTGGYGYTTEPPRTFQTQSDTEYREVFRSTGGRIKVHASSTSGGRTVQTNPFYITVTGPPAGIPDQTITDRLVSLYSGGATPRLMTGIAQVESTYQQFAYLTLYGRYDKWPYESYDGGTHVGLMQVVTTPQRAWDWLINTNDGANIFIGGLSISRTHEAQDRQAYPNLPTLTDTQHEDNSLGYYRLGTAKSNRYWIPSPDFTRWIENEQNSTIFNYVNNVKGSMR